MAFVTVFNDFSEQQVLGTHQWGSHTFKVALSNTAPLASYIQLSEVTQIAAGNGYSAGGNATTIGVSETDGITTVTGTQVTFTASGGSIGPFRYFVLYNDTSTGDKLVAWWDRGGSTSLANTESYVFQFNNASPGNIFQHVTG